MIEAWSVLTRVGGTCAIVVSTWGCASLEHGRDASARRAQAVQKLSKPGTPTLPGDAESEDLDDELTDPSESDDLDPTPLPPPPAARHP